jgi:hypothetical protein
MVGVQNAQRRRIKGWDSEKGTNVVVEFNQVCIEGGGAIELSVIRRRRRNLLVV